MRQGELLGLRWRDVDFEAAAIQVRHSLQRIDGVFQLVEPKSAKSRRVIAIGDEDIAALRHHKATQAEERLRVARYWEDHDLVFCNDLGKPLEVSNLTLRYFRPLLKKAGLPQIRFHDLRHTAATSMLAARVDVKVVSDVLGHSQAAFTMDRYQHVSLEMQRGALQAVQAMRLKAKAEGSRTRSPLAD
jgi:integrase